MSGVQEPGPLGRVPSSPDPLYRLHVDTPASVREAEAHARAEHRHRRQRDTLRPLGLLVVAAVVIGAINERPSVAWHGEGLGVVVAVAVFTASLVLAVRWPFVTLSVPLQTAVIAAMGGAGIALSSLQPHGAADLAGAVAVWMAVARLPIVIGVSVALGVTLGLVVALVLNGASASVIFAAALLCALLALVAYFVKQARASQDTAELLLAQLEDAREEQLRAAAVAERGRIAAELHDVLAHSLSGAAIQLQGARKAAERDGASSEVAAAIDRAAELVREGLSNARQAVSALRGDSAPGVAELEVLVDAFRRDTESDVTLRVEGAVRALSPDADLALYRGAQEALTNIVRYAPGASTTIVLRYDATSAVLTIEDRLRSPLPADQGLPGVGGGHGLAGLRERLRRSGGDLRAGPTESGWRVELEVPA